MNVSWNDAVAFCNWLSHKEGQAYRLPTEAEWEYACRAETAMRFCHGDNPEILASTANTADAAYKSTFPGERAIHGSDGYIFTSPAGNFAANGFGLHDMDGNVCDWCSDRYDAGYYADSPVDDPAGPASGEMRIDRGGAWTSGPYKCEACYRSKDWPTGAFADVGFRIARTR